MRYILKPLAILYVRYLQWRYKTMTVKNRYDQYNQALSRLILIQSKLYYYKSQFNASGYFHPDCVWSKKDERFYNWLFPEKGEFEEIGIVVEYNPEAITYYKNEIYRLSKGKPPKYEKTIKKQLKEWRRWN